MTQSEEARRYVLESVDAGGLRAAQAAEVLGVSERISLWVAIADTKLSKATRSVGESSIMKDGPAVTWSTASGRLTGGVPDTCQSGRSAGSRIPSFARISRAQRAFSPACESPVPPNRPESLSPRANDAARTTYSLTSRRWGSSRLSIARVF